MMRPALVPGVVERSFTSFPEVPVIVAVAMVVVAPATSATRAPGVVAVKYPETVIGAPKVVVADEFVTARFAKVSVPVAVWALVPFMVVVPEPATNLSSCVKFPETE